MYLHVGFVLPEKRCSEFFSLAALPFQEIMYAKNSVFQAESLGENPTKGGC